jgi:hypothetical protein
MAHRRDREKILAIRPNKKETPWSYGMRCWRAGQRGQPRGDWDAIKVDAMLAANRAKLEQNPRTMLAGLLASDTAPLSHRGSSKFWDRWNPIILTLLREELGNRGRLPHDRNLIAGIRDRMKKYRERHGAIEPFDAVAALQQTEDGDRRTAFLDAAMRAKRAKRVRKSQKVFMSVDESNNNAIDDSKSDEGGCEKENVHEKSPPLLFFPRNSSKK